jgi:hypothetical protein
MNVVIETEHPTRDTDHQNHDAHNLSKKIKHFVFSPKDVIGKGFSSVVYQGINEVSQE